MKSQAVAPPAKTYKFNPGFQSDEEAIQNFIVRREEFERIVTAFRDPAAPLGPRALVIAPRGAGKTTLCRRMLAETHRSDELSRAWHPVYFGEESYAVTTPGEFFLECLFHLLEVSPDAERQAEYEEVAQLPDEKQLLNRTLAMLRSFSKDVDKRLLIIVENFQIILEDQIGAGAKELLKHLRDEKLFGILATSLSHSDPDEADPLPSDFLRVPLRPLDLPECHALWKALTDRDVKLDRIRPLQILTGGSPRLLHILAEFMRTPSLRNLMENLNLLIDQNTEYFKSQLDALPAIERKVFAALLDAWDPSTAKQIAEAARVNTNVASAMLARLAARGSVIKEAGRGRTAIYYAAERLFNIYYLMRRRSHPSSRVHALVSFMTEYYDRDELIDTAAILAREACLVRPDNRIDYHSTFDALLSRAPRAVRARMLELAPADFLSSWRQHWEAEQKCILQSTKITAKEADGGDSNLKILLNRARRAGERDDAAEAVRLSKEAVETDPNSDEAWMLLSVSHLQQGQYAEAVKAARELAKIEGNEAWGLAIEGLVLDREGRRDEAITAYERTLKIDPNQSIALNELAAIYEDGDEDKAIHLYRTAQGSEALSEPGRVRFALLLEHQGKQDQAESVLRQVIDKPDSFPSRRVLVDFLSRNDREAEGVEILRRAAEKLDSWQAWTDYGSFSLARTKDFAVAQHALGRAIELGVEEPEVYTFYASALQRREKDKREITKVAEDVVRKFASNAASLIEAGTIYRMVGAKQRAEGSFREAIELDGGVPALLRLGRLLQNQPSRMSDAEEIFRRAVAASDDSCAPSKELAQLLVHEGEETAAMAVLREALEKYETCYCCTVTQAEISARNNDKKAAKTCYEAALMMRENGIQALTGLSRIVGREEAEKLIDRAVAAGPRDPRCFLARAQLRDEDPKSQIADATEALKLRPSFIEARLFLIPLLAGRGDIDAAFVHLKTALGELPTRRELISAFVDATMVVAASGASERVSKLIEEDAYGSTLEPLAVALKLKRGEKPVVAKEVMAVAEDIAGGLGTQSTAHQLKS